MPVPRSFIWGLAAGLGLAIAVYVGLLYSVLGQQTVSSSWAYDIMQKKRALGAATPGPRLLLIGGSGTTFGLSAERIQAQTGVHTLNMGTHAGLNLDHILYWARSVARPGDIVLLTPEYELYLSTAWELHDDYVLSHDVAFFRQTSLLDKIYMATRIPFKRIQKGFAIRRKPESPPRPHPPYTTGAKFLNDYGDETGNPASEKLVNAPNMLLRSDILGDGLYSDSGYGFDQIRAFAAWAKAHQVRVLATWPNIIRRADYDTPKADGAIRTIADFYRSLDIPVVGTAQESMLPSDDFFDTIYHLTREAAVKRTDRLVPHLKPFLEEKK